ncbi:MAG: hypothetical protein HY820_25270 [Acidobacteria bacterium]|nr:hypothetical protein [Acidobacteriota bacterium]
MNPIQHTLTACLLFAVLTTAAQAAPIVFLTGSGVVNLRPDRENPNLLFPENTNGNELIFIITNNSNTNMRITNILDPTFRFLSGDRDDAIANLTISDTNPCKGVTLVPTDVCAFSILFDAVDNSGVNDSDFGRWRITPRVSVSYATTNTLGVSVPTPALLTTNVRVTVFDPAASFNDPGADAVPEPSTCYLLLSAVPFLIVGKLRRRQNRN